MCDIIIGTRKVGAFLATEITHIFYIYSFLENGTRRALYLNTNKKRKQNKTL